MPDPGDSGGRTSATRADAAADPGTAAELGREATTAPKVAAEPGPETPVDAEAAGNAPPGAGAAGSATPGDRPAPTSSRSGASPLRSRLAARAEYMMGPETRECPPDRVLAWEGFLELHRRLFRDAVAALDREHGLSVSMLGMLGRLARTEHRALSTTALAAAIDLSLSRISRLVDVLEHRGLVERHPCPSDGRTTNIVLTDEGLAAAEAAQKTVMAFARERFVDRLTDDETATLSAVFLRLIGPARGEW